MRVEEHRDARGKEERHGEVLDERPQERLEIGEILGRRYQDFVAAEALDAVARHHAQPHEVLPRRGAPYGEPDTVAQKERLVQAHEHPVHQREHEHLLELFQGGILVDFLDEEFQDEAAGVADAQVLDDEERRAEFDDKEQDKVDELGYHAAVEGRHGVLEGLGHRDLSLLL